jgi:hypothetical protein
MLRFNIVEILLGLLELSTAYTKYKLEIKRRSLILLTLIFNINVLFI